MKQLFLKFVYGVILSGVLSLAGHSQIRPDVIETQTGFYLSTSSRTPYLNRVRQYGLAPIEAQTWFVNAAMQQYYDSIRTADQKLRPWSYSWGVEAQANLGGQNHLYLPVAHISGRFKGWELYIGRKKETLGLADTTGTWGSYIWSGNALPLPKVQISTPNYISVLGKGFLSAKVGFSHGWFGKQRYTENYFLHQKWLYIKLGRETQKLNLMAGINQNAQWGGYSETLKDNDYASKNGHFASDGFAYLNVVLPFKFWKRPDDRYSPYEMFYRFGNHLGTVDLGFRMKTKEGTISVFRQTPWEDGQVPELFFSGDGNYTLIYQAEGMKYVQKIGIELLNTQRQANELSKFADWIGLKEKHPGEYQDYLNHGQYLEGWDFTDRGIGSPAIIPLQEILLDENFEGTPVFSRDNKVIAPAMNIEGKVGLIHFLVYSGYIFSTGQERNLRPERLGQFSGRLRTRFPIKSIGLYGEVDIAWDKGKLYGNQTGMNVTLVKVWE